ncbi:MAG: YcxB family protein [Ruminiclostridium sp.]|nr:YcxB family protein [Ruminiclostridium sp.]
MAFEALSGFRLSVSQTNQTFVIGDYFAVFDDDTDTPDVYEWSSVKGYYEQNDHFKLTFERAEYVLPKNAFGDNLEIIHFRTIVEGMLSGVKGVDIKIKERIIPPKYNYTNADLSSSVFTGTGIYSEKDINTGSVSHIYSKLRFPIWLIAALSAVGSFLAMWGFGKNLEDNYIFYLVIAFFIGLGVGIVIYLIMCIIARYRYSGFLKRDVSTVESIVFIVAPDGFGAIEQCIYCGKELIPWSFAKYFYETKYSISIVCMDKSVCSIPKHLFQKNVQNDLAEFIAARVDQD